MVRNGVEFEREEDVQWARGRSGGGQKLRRAGATSATTAQMKQKHTRRYVKRRRIYAKPLPLTAVCALFAASLPTSVAQSCISLEDSTACPSFNASSISTDDSVVGLFPFLSSVTDTASFDSGLKSYITEGFAQIK